MVWTRTKMDIRMNELEEKVDRNQQQTTEMLAEMQATLLARLDARAQDRSRSRSKASTASHRTLHNHQSRHSRKSTHSGDSGENSDYEPTHHHQHHHRERQSQHELKSVSSNDSEGNNHYSPPHHHHHRHREYSHHHHHRTGRKIDLPLFNGEDAYGWLIRIDRYFRLNHIEEDDKVNVAVVAMEDKALSWFQGWENQTRERNWGTLKAALTRRFQPELVQNPLGPLLGLKQEGN
ncbi:unnamed protein product [Cuscuta epithymum]|uniref:Retrotransposon gag domain-containing protein n=1 Tax=Cuscuta epithymum TaxID=186058 RepID=A0AAV0DIT1_9ASTE|nr:unnamed protein product [Cuscuta epithymum]CAH9099689.1 unnamed protein product [Cuscuta epithymum]CAH9099693.1 unnamed protein product [Cuscuta epithymum]